MSNASRIGSDKSAEGKPATQKPGNTPNLDGELPTVFALLDQDRLVSDLSEMIKIPSINPFEGDARPGYREKEMAEFYLDRMSDLGLETGCREVSPGRPNVWGVLKGKGEGPSLMLSGHLDTVGTDNYPDALRAKVTDSRVYGRGACDMKAGLAAYLEVVRLLRETDTQLMGDLVITGLADEEHMMTGSRDLGANGPWADYGIIGEPSDMIICPAHKGQLGFRIRTFGQAVHSSQPEKGVNAIAAMAKVIEAFNDYNKELKTRNTHQLCGHASSCPSVIHGGTILSTVPDFCELEVDRRTLPGETVEDVLEEYRRLLDPLSEAFAGFSYKIKGPTLDISPLDIPIDNPVVQSLAEAYSAILKGDGTISAFFGGTDAPNLGFPTVIFGPGAIAQAHSTNEFVEIADMVDATKVYLWTILKLLA
jgi:acetylornithine deacetylase/succinyl-diaminopimelate desuccinylase family protein